MMVGLSKKRQLTSREYGSMLLNRDPRRHKLRKTRRCFIWENQYFQLDTYNKPCPKVCENLMILETYTTNTDKKMPLPPFLTIEKEITGNKQYSMFQLSVKEESGESQETNVQVIPRCQSTSMPKSVNSFASLNGIQAESGRKRSPSDSSGISSSPRGYSCLEDNDMPLP